MIGRFLLGAMAGAAVVAGGLLVSAALSPPLPPASGTVEPSDAAPAPAPAPATMPEKAASEVQIASGRSRATGAAATGNSSANPAPAAAAGRAPLTLPPASGVTDVAPPLTVLDKDAVLAALGRAAVEAPGGPDASWPATVAEKAVPDIALAPDAPGPVPTPRVGILRQPDGTAPMMPGTRPAPFPMLDDGDVVPASQTPLAESSTFRPVPRLPGLVDRAGVSPLPQAGSGPGSVSLADPAASPPVDNRPIARFAARFANPLGKPTLAIVLVDDDSARLDREALAALPFPVSLALDPMDPRAAERAAIYRAGGKEVVMLATGIAERANASDVEVAFQSMAQSLPQAVAVMDLRTAAFQNRRPLASLVVPVIAAQGRGLLTWDQGLNAADQVARRDDVAAAMVFRDLTSAGTDTRSVRRMLDRAVFKAAQEGRAVVAATAAPDIVAALVEWAVEGRAATVALAPVTAVMRVE